MKMKRIPKKLFVFFIALCFIAMSGAGCGHNVDVGNSSTNEQKDDSNQNQTKKLTFLYVHATNTMDPHVKSSGFIPLRTGAVETLVKIGDDLKLEPWLLEKWESEDGQNWTFTLRDNISFQNGKKLDAEVVKANIERMIEMNPGTKISLDIKGMEVSDGVLKIITNEPNSSLPSEFTHPCTCIIDLESEDIDNKPIGTGAFIVDNFTPGASVKLRKNDKYWDGEVKVDEVNFEFNQDANARLQALQSAYADVIFKPASEAISTLQADPNITIEKKPSFRANKILYNVQKPFLDNENFRKGIDCLINRDEIVSRIMFEEATPAYGPFMKELPFSIDYDINEFGLENALEHFERAGLSVRDNKVTYNGQPIKLKVVTYGSRAELPPIIQTIQSNAKNLGIEMEIQMVEGEMVDDYLKTNDWDICGYSMLTCPRGDASYYLKSSLAQDGVLNHGKINDPELNKLIEEYNITLDEDLRNHIVKKILEIVNEKNYYSYVAYPNTIVGYNNKSVKSWKTYSSEFYMITKDIEVN